MLFLAAWCSEKKLSALIEGKPELDLYDVILYPADGDQNDSINADLVKAGYAGEKREAEADAVQLESGKNKF